MADERLMFTTLISTADLAAHLADPAFVLVDVRHDLAQPDAWGEPQYRAGHLPGARFAHLDRDLSAPKTGRNGRHPLPRARPARELFGRLGIDAAKQVVAYDQGSGMYAARLWWMLRALGHDAAAVLDGGFAAWTREGRPVATATPAVTRSHVHRAARASNLDAPAVAASLRGPLAAPRRRPRSRALSRRRRAARPGRRAHSRRAQPALRRESRCGGQVQGGGGRCAAEFGALLGGRTPAGVVH